MNLETLVHRNNELMMLMRFWFSSSSPPQPRRRNENAWKHMKSQVFGFISAIVDVTGDGFLRPVLFWQWIWNCSRAVHMVYISMDVFGWTYQPTLPWLTSWQRHHRGQRCQHRLCHHQSCHQPSLNSIMGTSAAHLWIPVKYIPIHCDIYLSITITNAEDVHKESQWILSWSQVGPLSKY